MKKRKLVTPAFIKYEMGFKQWLKRMGYSESAQYNMPLMAREWMYFMEQRSIYSIHNINPDDTKSYFKYLSSRKNERRGGGISQSHYNKYLQAIKNFVKYLWYSYKILVVVDIKRRVIDYKKPEVLTLEEISALYESTSYNRLLRVRDQMILDLCYGCGLRRNEAVNVKLEDVYIERRMLYVRSGKHYSQRYVPFTETMAKRIRHYVDHVREDMIKDRKHDAFLISLECKPIKGHTMLLRVKALQECTKLASIKNKTIGLHTLRHSIATHLMKSGVRVKKIAKFLGHQSMESTQLYTHLLEDV